MVGFKRLKQWLWYQKRVEYLKNIENKAKSNLNYFAYVRKYDSMRQKIGLQDMNVSTIPKANPKKEKVTMGPPAVIMKIILEELPYQYEILGKWQRRNKVRNTSLIGKVIFT